MMNGDNFYQAYDRFEALPEHVKNAFGASKWYQAWATEGVDPAFACDCFKQIPPNLVNDDLRKYAVFYHVQVIDLIDPSDTPAYKSICLNAYRSSYKAAQFFKAEVHTAEMVELMIRDYTGSFLDAYRSCPWIAELMTPALIEKACLTSDVFMLSLPDALMSRAALDKHLGEGTSTYSLLKKVGRLHIGVDYLKGGRWPESNGPFDDDVQKPESLLEAFSLLLGNADIPRALYMAYVMTHDIKDVLALVVTPSCAKLAVEMYDEKELRPHIKTNRHLRAAMLEESLGL
jgi:hypothetical protein